MSGVSRTCKLIPAAASARDVRVVKIVEERDVATAICRQADEFGADLVCIGAHGHSALLARALGSVAQEIVAQQAPGAGRSFAIFVKGNSEETVLC